jgi:hypothetical protein
MQGFPKTVGTFLSKSEKKANPSGLWKAVYTLAAFGNICDCNNDFWKIGKICQRFPRCMLKIMWATTPKSNNSKTISDPTESPCLILQNLK